MTFLPLTLGRTALALTCYAAIGAASAAQDAPANGFTAFGSGKTSWRAVVSGERLQLEGESFKEATLTVERQAWAKGVEYSGSEGTRHVTLTIQSKRCKDADGNIHPLSATLRDGKKTRKGCAVEGALGQAPT